MAKKGVKQATSRRKKVISPPTGDRAPMKTNAYRLAQYTEMTLAPLFPFLDEGSLIPCLAAVQGGPGKRFGRFRHFNTVDEIVMIMGVQGPYSGAGMVRVESNLHLVQMPFEDPEDDNNVVFMVITQRQRIGEKQKEQYRFLCDKCDRQLFMVEVDATPPKRGKQRKLLGPYYPFPTILETYKAAQKFNGSEKIRTCKKCGHVNPTFPTQDWGWDFCDERWKFSETSREILIASQKRPSKAKISVKGRT